MDNALPYRPCSSHSVPLQPSCHDPVPLYGRSVLLSYESLLACGLIPRAYYSRHTVAVLPHGSPSQSPLLLYMPSRRIGGDLKHSRAKLLTRPMTCTRLVRGSNPPDPSVTSLWPQPAAPQGIAGRESRRKTSPQVYRAFTTVSRSGSESKYGNLISGLCMCTSPL